MQSDRQIYKDANQDGNLQNVGRDGIQTEFLCESIFSCLFLFLQLYYVASFKKQLAIIKRFFIPLLITTKQKPLIDKPKIISNEPKHIATLVRPCILISRVWMSHILQFAGGVTEWIKTKQNKHLCGGLCQHRGCLGSNASEARRKSSSMPFSIHCRFQLLESDLRQFLLDITKYRPSLEKSFLMMYQSHVHNKT